MLSPSFPGVEFPHLDGVPLPDVMRVALSQPTASAIADVPAAVSSALALSKRLSQLERGASVAVAVGSRGIANIDRVSATVIKYLKDLGHRPFVVPAMGSHGGGTAEGQAAVLAHLGVTEGRVGAPVRATMEVVHYGKTDHGIPCAFDRRAAGADAIVLLARVKSHTSFDRPIESGLVKMTAVGLGKAEGARNVHRLGVRGYTEVLPALAKISLSKGPIAFGIAMVENASHELVIVEGVEPADFFSNDERLLRRAKQLLARLPFEQIDLLVVEQIGKDVSGAGMDHAVTGRTEARGLPNLERPFVNKLVVLGLTPAAAGNALGIGAADFTTRNLANAIDLKAMYLNMITATFVEKARIPIVLSSDKAAIQTALATCWRLDPANARYCQIRSTLHLDEVLLSPSLFEDIGTDSGVERRTEPKTLRFDNEGNLLDRLGPV